MGTFGESGSAKPDAEILNMDIKHNDTGGLATKTDINSGHQAYEELIFGDWKSTGCSDKSITTFQTTASKHTPRTEMKHSVTAPTD